MNSAAPDLCGVLKDWISCLKHGKQSSPHTCEAYQRDICAFITFLNHHYGRVVDLKSISDVSLTDLRSWLAERSHQDYSIRSSRRAVSSLKSFYKFLSQQKGLSNRAISLIRLPRPSQDLPRPLSTEQSFFLFDQILALSSEPWVGARDRALFMLLYGTGLRISEALSLKYSDSQEQGLITITGKGRKQRQVPILPIIHQVILEYLEMCPHAFEAKSPLFRGVSGKVLSAGVAQRQLRFYRQALGLPEKTTPHAFRHSCATDLMSESHDLRGIQELLGHAQLSTTQIYTHLDQNQLMKVFSKAHPRMRSLQES